MKPIKRYKPVESKRLAIMIFALCWIAYFSTYIGRLNYSAAMTQMINEDFLSKLQGGLIGTFFFACYGIGQFFNGFIGDRASPFKMIFFGIFISAISNLLMAVFPYVGVMYLLWGINGFAQSMIWSPIMRIFSQLLPAEQRFRACVNINSTVPAGTIFTYLLSTLLLGTLGWKSVFSAAFIFLIAAALIWGIFYLKNRGGFVLEEAVIPQRDETHTEKKKSGLLPILILSGVVLMLFPTAVHGMLKDGITTWFPTYLVEKHNMLPNISVLLTTILPLFNLTGAYIASAINNKFVRNDLKTAGLMFVVSSISLALLAIFGGSSIVLAILLTAVATSAMFGVNTLMVSVLPMYFGKVGLASTVTGILNSATYIGCALSMGLFGAMIEVYSWTVTIAVWCILAVIGGIMCFALTGKWRKYRETIAK